MPLIRIALAAGKPLSYRQAIADGVHHALIDSLKAPVNDRFQIVSEQPADSLIFDNQFLGIHRSADLVFIQVFLRRGRTTEMKQDFYRQVAANLTANPGLSANDIFITLSENDVDDWSFGQGRAQYVENPPQPVTTSASTNSTTVKKAKSTSVSAVAKAAGSLLVGGFVTLALLAVLHAASPAQFDAALAQGWPSTDLVALAGFTA